MLVRSRKSSTFMKPYLENQGSFLGNSRNLTHDHSRSKEMVPNKTSYNFLSMINSITKDTLTVIVNRSLV